MSHKHPPRRRTASSIIVATLLTAPALALAFPSQAAAECEARGPKDIDCNISGVIEGTTGGGGGRGGGTGGSGPFVPPPPEGLTENQAIDAVAVPGGNAPIAPAPPTTWLLVQQASDSAALPIPRVHTAPENKTYVRLRTVLWVDGFETVQTEPITVGDQTVQATAEPQSVTWDLGEKKLVCDDAGSKEKETCTYTYRRSSSGHAGGAYQITATVTWKLHWTCEGADCDSDGGTLSDQTRTSQPTPLIVSEIQTNTGQ